MANGIIGKVTAGGGTHLVTSTFYGTCATAAGTAAKIVKLADATADAATAIVGMTLAVKFTNSNTVANPTLTVQRNSNTTNLIAATSIKAYGTTAPGTTVATSWRAGAVVLFVYVADGSNYYWTQVSSLDDNTTYSSQAAASGGTTLSLVTTGEKYTWNNKSTLAIGTTSTTAAAGNHNHDSTYVNVSGDTMTGALTMKGSDIILGTSGTSSDDSGDLYWTYGNGQEKMRIWSQNTYTAKSGPNFRVYKSDGTSLYNGTLALADHTHDDRYYTETEINTKLKKYVPSFTNYRNTNGNNSGKYYKIAINSYVGWMINFTVKLYHAYRAYDIQISGYNYGSSHWYSPKAVLLGTTQTDSINVIFGYDSDYHLWAAIPAQQYTGISICGVTNGFTEITDFENLFTITMVDAEPTTKQTTVTARKPLYTDEMGTLATKSTISAHSYTPAGTITLTNENTTTTVSAASSGTTTYTPGGTVSQPTFTGSSLTSTGNFTPAGSVSVSTNATTNKSATVSAASSGDTTYTPGGTNSAPAFTGTAATIVVNGGTGTATYTPAGTIAVNGTTSTATVIKTATFNTVVTSATVANEILTISTGASGSSTNQTGVRIADPAYKFTGTGTRLTASYTPAGSVAAPTFTGTAVRLVTGNIAVPNTYTATFTGTQGSVSVSGTPAGTVSKPTFSGTAVRLVTGNISRPTSATFAGTAATLSHTIS